MIINLFGPPGSGKTTLASLLCIEQPSFIHLSIDSYRKDPKRDSTAWYELVKALMAFSGDAIVESSGLSKSLKQYILDRYEMKKRGIVHVYISCPEQECIKRVCRRSKDPIHFQYNGLSVEDVIRHVIGNVPSTYDESGYYEISSYGRGVEDTFEDFKRIVDLSRAAGK